VLPIAFGVLNDLTGIWTSCFMLLFLVAAVSLVWMHVAIRRWSASRGERSARKLPELPEMQEMPSARACRQALGQDPRGLAPGGQDLLGRRRAADRAAQSVDLDPRPAAVVRGLDGVVGRRRQAAASASPSPPTSCSGSRRCRAVRRDAAHLLLLHGADLRRTAVDDARDLVADDPGHRHRLRRAEPGHALLDLPRAGAALRLRRRQLRLLDVQHLFFFPKAEKGNALALNAGLGNLGVSVVQFVVPLVITAGVFGWLGGDAPRPVTQGATPGCGCRTPASSGCRSSSSAFAAWFGMNDIASAKRLVRRAVGDLPAQAQLDHVLALHRHLRLLHRLLGGFPLLAKTQFPEVNACNTPSSGRWSARCRAR
jgi:NNP family nitrate/nitrite transporter-like MFS transporter